MQVAFEPGPPLLRQSDELDYTEHSPVVIAGVAIPSG
jgi:hypothetical protein